MMQFGVGKSWKIVKISSCAPTPAQSMWKLCSPSSRTSREKESFSRLFIFSDPESRVLVKWKQEEVCKPAPDVIRRLEKATLPNLSRDLRKIWYDL
jgi:hypothetical protein